MAEAQAQADPAVRRARLRGKRIALGVVITVAVAYIGLSAVDIIPQVFGVVLHPLPMAPAGSPARTCAEGIRRLASTPEAPAANDDARAACAASKEGLDAWAALERLWSARRQLAGRDGAPRDRELEKLRGEVLAHLPAELR